MTRPRINRRSALRFALGGLAGLASGPTNATRAAPLYRRVGVAFGTTVSITLQADSREQAEDAFAAGFAEIRHIDRLASLTHPEGQVFQLNRDGFLDRPDPALLAMLRMARAMHAATDRAFDISIQPLWLAFDAAAKRGSWLNDAEIADIRTRVDQERVAFGDERVEFTKPGMAVTLNSLARGLAADRVADVLTRLGVANAFFDTDVLGSRGRRPDDAMWRALVRHPRKPDQSVGVVDVRGCLATSGDYQYFWSPDYARNHIIDPRHGASPGDFSSVSVLAKSGLAADALSTAAFLVGAKKAPALLQKFGAEALFVDKAGVVSSMPGFPHAAILG